MNIIENIVIKTSAVALMSLMTYSASAQDVNREHYRDYAPLPEFVMQSPVRAARAGEELPAFVDNSKTIHFPPIFNQSGGSCGSSSNEGYGLTYELNALRNANGKMTKNQYPTHWIFLLAYQNSDRDEITQKLGIPNVDDYGGRTYSKIFGEQDETNMESGRMQGYDKWYRAMFNRSRKQFSFPYDLTTEQGKDDLKRWIWNHQGDTDFAAGGVALLGIAIIDSQLGNIPRGSKNNRANGFANKKYITSWGPQYDHGVAIVGYDDRVEFDFDGDKVYGEAEEEELGAWIICNSWGDGYANGGFVYCPYKYSYSVKTDQMPMTPYAWLVRKNYEPKRTLRIEMEYSHRSELQLVAGISDDKDSDVPTVSTNIPMFNYDGNVQNLSPAPEVPMLGRWADGMHHEPIEFGFDVTDLTEEADDAHELKYFLQINTKADAIGSGKVHRLSLIDYENGEATVEALEYGVESVEIKNGGQTTYISLTIPGKGTFRPEAPTFSEDDNTFSWTAPENPAYPIKGYAVYQNGVLVASLGADELSYTPDEANHGYLQVTALYDNDGKTIESRRTELLSPVINKNTQSAKIACDLDGRYLGYIRDMALNGTLTDLDLSEATIIDSDYTYMDGKLSKQNTIGENLFKNCKKLQSVKLPLNTLTIEGGAFSGCDALTSIEIPDAVTVCGFDSFSYNPALEKVTIGSSVKTMNQGVFYASNVKEVYAKPMTPPTLSAYVLTSNPVIHVYKDALEAYQESGWAQLGTLVGDLDEIIPSSIEDVETGVANDKSVYTIDGVKLNGEPEQGVFIKDGKKYVKK